MNTKCGTPYAHLTIGCIERRIITENRIACNTYYLYILKICKVYILYLNESTSF